MPLPDGNPTWPPPSTQAATRLYNEHGAWWAGDTTRLANVYGIGASVTEPRDHITTPASPIGFFGRVRRWFWGQPSPAGQPSAKLHLPLAADIASTSADLLFAEPPAFVIGDDPDAQNRLDTIADRTGLYSTLHEAGEIAAAYGGVYLTTAWNLAVESSPFTVAHPPDVAAPDFVHGRLVGVTFWSQVRRDGGDVWRHLERHEPGVIYHGLYKGTASNLGRPVPLAEHPATADLAEHVNDTGAIVTGARGLTARYVPNMRPHRTLRGPLGRSDYAGIEPALDSLDETWTSLIRDLRLGKARLVVPDVYLQSLGRGAGARFDPDREVYSALNMLPRPDAPGNAITPVQFKLRVDEHLTAARALTGEAIRGAGYSAQTFGETPDVATTATEVVARERRSYTTRARKIGYWRPELAAHLETLLEVDAARFDSGITPARPSIEWPDGVSIDPEAQARTIQTLAAADAMSIRTRLAMLHPDWDDDQIRDEAAAIAAETGVGTIDPETTLRALHGADVGTPAGV